MPTTRQPLATLALLALIGVSSAGCSHAPASTGPTGSAVNIASAAHTAPTAAASGSNGGTSTDDARAQAMQFSACMRGNGVSDFPDPDASGRLTIDQVANGASLNTSSAAFKQALSACQMLEPPGFTGSTRSAQQQQAALKFAQCIRDNGVPDFPDPAPDAPLVDTNRIPSAARTGGISALNAAMKKCRDFATAAGVTGSN
jgi:hypothetical protein